MAEALHVAAGMLTRIEPAVGRDAAGTIEARDRLEHVHHGQSSQQSHARMGSQPLDPHIRLRSTVQLLLHGPDLLGRDLLNFRTFR